MDLENKELVLFTSFFPYGQEKETFLETEILFLARRFRTIYILPTYTDNFIRNIPTNVVVVTEHSNLKFSKSAKNKILIKTLIFTYKMICAEIKNMGFLKFLKNKNIYLDYLAHQLLTSEQIIPFILEKNTSVFYNYWFSNRTLALCLIKKKYPKITVVARAHGYDLYDERWNGAEVPFRHTKIKYLNALFLISSHGYNYIKTKINKEFHEKLSVFKLGVSPQIKKSPSLPTSKKPLVVSIARLIPLKNIHLIPIMLEKLNIPIKWIHFGDGPDMPKLVQACDNLSSNVEIELRGGVPNSEIQHFLSENQITLFISLSSSEGIPVSMMEAQSVGIPIISTIVGGTPEIVIDGVTGFLIPDLNNSHEIILKALNQSFSRNEIVRFYEHNYNAFLNYEAFADCLIKLTNVS